MRVVGSVLVEYVDVVTLWLTIGEPNVLSSSIWTMYVDAPATSDQSNTMFCRGLKRASAAGLTCDGGGQGPPPPAAGLTVSVAVRLTPADVAVIVAAVVALTEVVVAVNVLLVAPALTVTLAGTVTAAELSDSVTTAPPAGAAALSVTVPVDELPPTTADGLTVTADHVADAARVMLKAANSVVLLRLAVRDTVVLSTGKVVTVNDAVDAPGGMVTLGGTLAEPGKLLPRLTATPPAGAALSIVTVPVAEVPPGTLVGLTEKPVSVGRLGATTRSADSVTPPPVTEIVTVVRVVTAAVAMSKPPNSVDAGTVAKAGTEATAGLLLVTRSNWS